MFRCAAFVTFSLIIISKHLWGEISDNLMSNTSIKNYVGLVNPFVKLTRASEMFVVL